MVISEVVVVCAVWNVSCICTFPAGECLFSKIFSSGNRHLIGRWTRVTPRNSVLLQKPTVARSGNMNSKARSLPKSQELATELDPASGPGCHQSVSTILYSASTYSVVFYI